MMKSQSRLENLIHRMHSFGKFHSPWNSNYFACKCFNFFYVSFQEWTMIKVLRYTAQKVLRSHSECNCYGTRLDLNIGSNHRTNPEFGAYLHPPFRLSNQRNDQNLTKSFSLKKVLVHLWSILCHGTHHSDSIAAIELKIHRPLQIIAVFVRCLKRIRLCVPVKRALQK